jgi:transposase
MNSTVSGNSAREITPRDLRSAPLRVCQPDEQHGSAATALRGTTLTAAGSAAIVSTWRTARSAATAPRAAALAAAGSSPGLIADSGMVRRAESAGDDGTEAVAQGALFYEFSLERHVPEDHLLRSIDRFVDLGDVRGRLAPLYSSTGRPSVDPELMIRMLLVGYCFGIRSERRLCEEVHLNLAYRWFCRLDLGDPVPDHSTFSKNRHGRFRDCDLLRHVFEATVRRCIEWPWSEPRAVDLQPARLHRPSRLRIPGPSDRAFRSDPISIPI